jgi:hypothetical protein
MYATKRNLFVLNHYVFFRFNEFLLDSEFIFKGYTEVRKIVVAMS